MQRRWGCWRRAAHKHSSRGRREQHPHGLIRINSASCQAPGGKALPAMCSAAAAGGQRLHAALPRFGGPPGAAPGTLACAPDQRALSSILSPPCSYKATISHIACHKIRLVDRNCLPIHNPSDEEKRLSKVPSSSSSSRQQSLLEKRSPSSTLLSAPTATPLAAVSCL